MQRSMKTFVFTPTLRMVWTAVRDCDAKLEKPYRKPCPMFTGGVAPGRTIVDKESFRQAVMTESQFQTITHRVAALIGTSLQAQIVAGVIVPQGRRMSWRFFPKPYPAFEVHLPQQIGCQHLK